MAQIMNKKYIIITYSLISCVQVAEAENITLQVSRFQHLFLGNIYD